VLHHAGVRHAFVRARKPHTKHLACTTYMAKAGATRNTQAHRTTAQTAQLVSPWQTAHRSSVHARHYRDRGKGEGVGVGVGETSGAVAVEVSLVGSKPHPCAPLCLVDLTLCLVPFFQPPCCFDVVTSFCHKLCLRPCVCARARVCACVCAHLHARVCVCRIWHVTNTGAPQVGLSSTHMTST